jgi:hypothetical protein
MKNLVLLLLAILCIPLWGETQIAVAEPDLISSRIAEMIAIEDPLVLDIQAGDLTSALDYRIRNLLLQKGADLREAVPNSPLDYVINAPDGQAENTKLPLSLNRLNLVRVSMELGGITIERKSFFSFHSDRYPLYTFQIRQISLPAYKLERMDSLSFVDKGQQPDRQIITNVKWFEPVLATTAIASLIYLLWTTE